MHPVYETNSRPRCRRAAALLGARLVLTQLRESNGIFSSESHCYARVRNASEAARFVRPIEIPGKGDVVRVEPDGPEAGFGIAVKRTTPIRQIERHARP